MTATKVTTTETTMGRAEAFETWVNDPENGTANAGSRWDDYQIAFAAGWNAALAEALGRRQATRLPAPCSCHACLAAYQDDEFNAGWNAALAGALADADSVAARIAEAYTGGWNAHRAALEAVAADMDNAITPGAQDRAGAIRWALKEVELG